MRDHWRFGHLLRVDADHLARHGLAAAKDPSRHGGGADVPVDVVNIIYVRDVRNVVGIGYVSYVSHVYFTQIVIPIVVPGEKGLSGPEREPSRYAKAAEAEAERKSGSAYKPYQRRGVHRRHGNRPGHPSPG